MKLTIHEFDLPLRHPFNADWVFSFLAKRAIPGIEAVDGHCFSRTYGNGEVVRVRYRGDSLVVQVPSALVGTTAAILARTRRVFDLDAQSCVIDEQLGSDRTLRAWVDAAGGIRVPGVWDPLEGSVRAILGQQVSVERARVLATALVEAGGGAAFPDAEQLAGMEVAALGMPGTRGRAVSALAARVAAAGDGFLEDASTVRAELTSIRGIGPWTAEYVAMRVARDPDAFPDSDWVVLKVLGCRPAAARRKSACWQPWRAYAVMYLWYGSTTADSATAKRTD